MSWSDYSALATSAAFSSRMRDDTEVINISYKSGGGNNSVPVVVFETESNREFDEGRASLFSVRIVCQKSSLDKTPVVSDTFVLYGKTYTVQNVETDTTTFMIRGESLAKDTHNKDLIG